MQAMLLESWNGHDVRNWLMSEKFDGVRALWDGERLVSREGIEFMVPAELIADLPPVALDGELVVEGGTLEDIVSVIRSKDANWSRVRYMVFDVPSEAPMHERLNALRSLGLSGFARAVNYTTTDGIDFFEFEESVFEAGGEGIVIRDPSAPYVPGRSNAALKFKRRDTGEGEVIAITADHIQVLTSTGKKFKIRGRAAIGERVTFSFSGTTKAGTPRCPEFVCIRNYE